LNIKLLSEENIKQVTGYICTVDIPEKTHFICSTLSSKNTVWYIMRPQRN